MADYDQDTDCCEKLLTTREGIQTIALYSSSIGRSLCLPEPFLLHFGKHYILLLCKCLIEQPINFHLFAEMYVVKHVSLKYLAMLLKCYICLFCCTRFANAEGAFIYPMYGHGELPQAFCRCAAVKGALYVRWSSQTSAQWFLSSSSCYCFRRQSCDCSIFNPNSLTCNLIGTKTCGNGGVIFHVFGKSLPEWLLHLLYGSVCGCVVAVLWNLVRGIFVIPTVISVVIDPWKMLSYKTNNQNEK